MDTPALRDHRGAAPSSFHAWPIDQVLAALRTTRSGLTESESARRLAQYGLNRLQRIPQVSAVRILADQLTSIVVLLLIAAGVVSLVLGDRIEAAALADVFGERGVPVMAIKGALGESGAMGAAALQAALDALRCGRLQPTVGFEQPDPACPVDVSSVARPLAGAGRVALVNSFASGGSCYALAVSA